MKILMIFADMVGSDYIHSGNPERGVCAIDSLMEELGGVYYDNCYTPAPDTPRSSACMWSGLYPRKNGCDNRLKYPGPYLKTDVTLWKVLEEESYEINAYVEENMNLIGLLPMPYEKRVKEKTYRAFLENLVVRDNSLTFIRLPDLHFMMDANGYDQKRFRTGTDIIVDCIHRLFAKVDMDEFDYILIFSDHGFRIKNQTHLIEDDRVKTMMFLHRRGDKGLKWDHELRSNLDVFPTVLEMIGVDKSNYKSDGLSLFGEGHISVLIEDHDDFSVRLGNTIEHWAVRDKSGFHWLECSGKWEHQRTEDCSDEEAWERTIIEKMSDYEQNKRLYQTLHRYDNYKLTNAFYSTGDKITVRLAMMKYPKLIRRLIGGAIRAVH